VRITTLYGTSTAANRLEDAGRGDVRLYGEHDSGCSETKLYRHMRGFLTPFGKDRHENDETCSGNGVRNLYRSVDCWLPAQQNVTTAGGTVNTVPKFSDHPLS